MATKLAKVKDLDSQVLNLCESEDIISRILHGYQATH
jgi:hypothetical protein